MEVRVFASSSSSSYLELILTLQCQIGREREVAVCLMQKFIDRGSDLQIRSVVALDHLKNYIYVEADKEAHVKEVFDSCLVEYYIF